VSGITIVSCPKRSVAPGFGNAIAESAFSIMFFSR